MVADKGRRAVRSVSLVWSERTWSVRGENIVPELDLPDSDVPEGAEPSFYVDVVDRSGKVLYSRSHADPRIGFYDHVTKEGELTGGVFARDFAVIDVLVPDVPGAELRLHAAAPEGLGEAGEALTEAFAEAGLTHVMGELDG